MPKMPKMPKLTQHQRENLPFVRDLLSPLANTIVDIVSCALSTSEQDFGDSTFDELVLQKRILRAQLATIKDEMSKRKLPIPNIAPDRPIQGKCLDCPAQRMCRNINRGCRRGVVAFRERIIT